MIGPAVLRRHGLFALLQALVWATTLCQSRGAHPALAAATLPRFTPAAALPPMRSLPHLQVPTA